MSAPAQAPPRAETLAPVPRRPAAMPSRLPGALAGLLAAYLLLAVAYGLATPILEAGDENWHEAAVWTIAAGKGLPVLDQADVQRGVLVPRQEAGQPPLYYLLAAAATFWIHFPAPAAAMLATPNSDLGHPDRSPWNKNLLVHTPAEDFPWHGLSLAVHLQRLLSTLLGALTVAGVYALAWLAAPRLGLLAPLAAAVVAFNPMFLFVSASVDNDAAAIALTTLVLLALVRALRFGATRRGALLTGVLLGLAALAKLSAAAVALPAVATYLWLAWRARSARQALRSLAALALPAVAIAGWWFVRNLALYGDPLGLAAFLRVAGLRERAPGVAGLLAEAPSVWAGFWGVFGTFDILLPRAYYLLAELLLLAAGLGLLRFWGRVWWRMLAAALAPSGRGMGFASAGAAAGGRGAVLGPAAVDPARLADGAPGPAPLDATGNGAADGAAALPRSAALGPDGDPSSPPAARSDAAPSPRRLRDGSGGEVLFLLASWLLLEVLLLARWTSLTEASSGRLLFPAFGSIAVAVALGLITLAGPLRRLVAAAVIAALAAGAALALPLAILPAYRAPAFVPAAALHPSRPLGIRYGNLELVGVDLPPAPLVPGGDTALTLYWRTLGPVGGDDVVSVQLLGPGGERVERPRTDALPGGGKVLTSRWPAGKGLVDTVPLHLRADAPSPSLVHVDVFVYSLGRAEAPLPARTADGTAPAGPEVGRLELRAPGPPPATPAAQAVFGGRIALLSAQAPAQVAAGGKVGVELRWQALAAPGGDFTVFVHVVGPDGRPLAQQDGRPQGGALPTTDWVAGQRVDDSVTVAIPAGTPPGDYPLEVGLYQAQSGRRLPLAAGGDAAAIGRLRVLPGGR